MSPLERNFKLKVADDLRFFDGGEFERFARLMLELILGEKVIHKGQNLYAKPVGYTADFADSEYEIIGQAGTDQDYYEGFTKPLKDVRGAIKNHNTAKQIYLFSNQYAGTSRLGELKKLTKTNEFKGRQVHIFDCERIAEIILKKIQSSHIVDEIFEFLPSAYELFRILPDTNKLPAHKDQYYPRIDESKIVKILSAEKVVQVYGLSGIGKTEITIGIAQRIAKNFETVIWVDCDDVQNSKIDLNAIKITKFDKLFNLAATLESYKVLVIFDNININVTELVKKFRSYNKKESQCLISSLSKSVGNEICYSLLEVSTPIAEKIISGDDPIDKAKISEILKYTGRHPLILKIVRSAVKNQVLTWDELIDDLKDLNQSVDDERNQTIANRIIGRIKPTAERELAAIKFINNRLIAKPLLNKMIGRLGGVEKLKNNTILGSADDKYYSIHQIILDSIKSEVSSPQWHVDFEERIKQYLIEHNETKNIGFYSVIFNHDKLLTELLAQTSDIELKRVIVYSMIQSTDIKNPQKTDELFRIATELIAENDTYYETLLTIELGEIKLWRINKWKEKDRYEEQAKQEIIELNAILQKRSEPNYQATLLHHIGKVYIKLSELDKAMEHFEQVLLLKPNDPFALLQIARIKKKENVRLTEIAEIIFGMQNCPLSILLSFYELIVHNSDELREKYINDDIEGFTSKILQAIDSRYDQPYGIIAKLSRDLSYNEPEYFALIVNNLPTPSNLDYNENLRFNYGWILSSYIKYGNIEAEPEKMNKALSLAKSILSKTLLESDFKKGIYVDVLIDDRSYDIAYDELQKYKDHNQFYFQKLSKIYRGTAKYIEAIAAAEKAIDLYKQQNSSQDYYLSAFLNDKADAEHALDAKRGKPTLEDAIRLQNNPKTKSTWENKLAEWSVICN